MDWDDAYANSAHIPGSDALPRRWAADAAAFRATARGEWDNAYGADPRCRFDLIHPHGEPRGLAVFIHGGYWMQTDKSLWSHLAAGAVSRGWAVALPSYPLAPQARISQIATHAANAVTRAASHVAGPIRLAGHSAGGHLAVRLVTTGGGLAPEVATRVTGCLGISGLYDLRPLMRTAMNRTLQLDEAEAVAESPVLLRPSDIPVTAWVGADERPAFLGQSRALREVWHGLGAEIDLVVDTGHNHFSVIDGLSVPDSPITRTFVGDTA